MPNSQGSRMTLWWYMNYHYKGRCHCGLRKKSQERTLEDEWNLERMRMDRGMVIKIMAPEEIHVLISETGEYITLEGKIVLQM